MYIGTDPLFAHTVAVFEEEQSIADIYNLKTFPTLHFKISFNDY